MSLLSILEVAFAVLLGSVARDLLMARIALTITRRRKEKKIAELDKLYNDLLVAEQAEADAEA